mgnify:CR=1 FL=1
MMSTLTIRTVFFGVFLLLAIAGFWSVALGAEPAQPVTREQVLAIAEELVTPGGCPSLTLAECTLPTAFKIREEIAQMLAQGMEKEEIIDALVAKYGKAILGAPKREGWGLVIWYMPYAVMVLAAIVLGGWLYHRRTTQAAFSAPPSANKAHEQGEEPTEAADIEQVLKNYL